MRRPTPAALSCLLLLGISALGIAAGGCGAGEEAAGCDEGDGPCEASDAAPDGPPDSALGRIDAAERPPLPDGACPQEANPHRTTPDGQPVLWRRDEIPWHLYLTRLDDVSPAIFRAQIEAGFAAWEAPECAAIRLPPQGWIEDDFVGWAPDRENRNVVILQRFEWAHQPELVGVVTLTYCTADAPDCERPGVILDADVELNARDFKFGVVVWPGPVMDLRSMATIHAGQLLGLETEGMGIFAGDIDSRELTEADRATLCCLYPFYD